MTIKIVIDVSLSPDWVAVFTSMGRDSVHWSAVGDPRAPDTEIMAWARTNGFVVFTHDLDFGTLLALTRANGPSVIQIRRQDVLPDSMSGLIESLLMRYASELEAGALLVVDEARARVRLLPI